MNLRLTPVQSRTLAICLLVLVCTLLVSLFAVPTIWLHTRYNSLLENYTDRLERYRRVAALQPAIESATDEVLKREGRKFYLQAPSPTLAAAELQGLVTRIVENNKGRITSIQVLPQKEEAQTKEPLKVTIHVQLTSSLVPLQLILHTLETHLPYLYIDSLNVASNHGRGYKPEPGVQPEFGIQLMVSAYALPGDVRK